MLDLGLLLLRVGAGLMMLLHGIGKVSDLFAGRAASFPDPIGLGSTPSLALAAFAEFLCALAVMIGFQTRLAALPVAFTMLVAGVVVHAGDDWHARELALVYAVVFLALALTGGGRYGIDGWLRKPRG